MSPRSNLLVSLATFHARLWLGGLSLVLIIPVSLAAAGLDFAAGRGPESGHYARVHRDAARLDAWLKGLGGPGRQPPVPGGAPVSVRESAPERRVVRSMSA